MLFRDTSSELLVISSFQHGRNSLVDIVTFTELHMSHKLGL